MEFVQYISTRASDTKCYHFRLIKGNSLCINGITMFSNFHRALNENQDFIRFNLGNKWK